MGTIGRGGLQIEIVLPSVVGVLYIVVEVAVIRIVGASTIGLFIHMSVGRIIKIRFSQTDRARLSGWSNLDVPNLKLAQ